MECKENDHDNFICAWTVSTMALYAILRDINGEEVDPDYPPCLRLRRCTSTKLKSRGISTSTPAKMSSSENTPRLCGKRHKVYLPPDEIIVVKEANVSSRVDLTVEEPSQALLLPGPSTLKGDSSVAHCVWLNFRVFQTLGPCSEIPRERVCHDSCSAPSILAT